MSDYKKYPITLITLIISFCVFVQNPDQLVLDLWKKNDIKYNSSKTGNPLLSGYFADPTIIEDNGTFYIYATSDMPSWNDITKLTEWLSKDFVR